MRFIYLLLSAFVAATSLQAHHPGDPGSSPASAVVLTPHLLAAGTLSLSWGYELTLYPELSAAELEAKVRAQGPQGKIQVPFSIGTQVLDLGLGAFDWLQVNVALRSQRMENLREGHMHGNGTYGSHAFGNPAGLANTELRLKARLAQGEHWSLAALAGATLPTGQDDALSDGVSVDASANTLTGKLKASPKFSYLSPAYQAGSGATVGTLALAAGREFGLWEADLSLTALMPAAYKGFKPGNSLSLGLAVGRLFGAAGHERGWFGLELAATQAEPSNTDGRSADDAGLVLAAGPRLRLPLGPRGLAVLGVSAPLVKPAHLDPAPLMATNASLQLAF